MKGIYESDGARLSFRENGAGQPWFFCTLRRWTAKSGRPLTEELGGVRGIVPDLRGHGGSQSGACP